MDGRLEQANYFDERLERFLSQGCNKCLFCYKISAKCQCTAETKVTFWSYPSMTNCQLTCLNWKCHASGKRMPKSDKEHQEQIRELSPDMASMIATLLYCYPLPDYYTTMLLCWWLLHDARISNGSLHRLARKRWVVGVLQHNIKSHHIRLSKI